MFFMSFLSVSCFIVVSYSPLISDLLPVLCDAWLYDSCPVVFHLYPVIPCSLVHIVCLHTRFWTLSLFAPPLRFVFLISLRISCVPTIFGFFFWVVPSSLCATLCQSIIQLKYGYLFIIDSIICVFLFCFFLMRTDCKVSRCRWFLFSLGHTPLFLLFVLYAVFWNEFYTSLHFGWNRQRNWFCSPSVMFTTDSPSVLIFPLLSIFYWFPSSFSSCVVSVTHLS